MTPEKTFKLLPRHRYRLLDSKGHVDVITRSLVGVAKGSFERFHGFGPTLVVPIQIFASGSSEVSDAKMQQAF